MNKYTKKYYDGGQNYGNNLYTPYTMNDQVQYNFQKIQDAQNEATEVYNQNQLNITNDYRNTLAKMNEDYAQRKKKEGYFKNTFKSLSNYKAKGDQFTKGQQANEFITSKLGKGDPLGVGVASEADQIKPGEWLNENLNPFAEGNIFNRGPKNQFTEISNADLQRAGDIQNIYADMGPDAAVNQYLGPNLEGYEIIDDQIVPVDRGMYDNTISGELGDYDANDFSTEYNPSINANVVINKATGSVVDKISSKTIDKSQELIGGVTIDPSEITSSFDLTGQLGEAGIDKYAGEVAKNVGQDVSEEIIKDGTGEIIKEGGEQAISKGAEEVGKAGAQTAMKAPVQGGLWTVPVDIGLHYLSDDGDPTTYTAAEVGTDVASLALDIATFDWIGAGFQLWDMGSQWFNRNKLRREQRQAEKEFTYAKADADIEYQAAVREASKYKGTKRGMYGRRSNTSELGGFNYNIQ